MNGPLRLIANLVIAVAGLWSLLISAPGSVDAVTTPALRIAWSLLLLLGGTANILAVAAEIEPLAYTGTSLGISGMIVYAVTIMVHSPQSVTPTGLFLAFALTEVEQLVYLAGGRDLSNRGRSRSRVAGLAPDRDRRPGRGRRYRRSGAAGHRHAPPGDDGS